jgi:hypothetical protein
MGQIKECCMNERRKLFEEWLIEQMGEQIKTMIDPDKFHKEDGYNNQDINFMWVGFNAGIEIAPLI